MARLQRLAVPLPVITLLVAELTVPPLAWASADLPTGEVPVSASTAEAAPGVKPAAAADPSKSAADSVSETGAFTWGLPLRLPPGRNGAAPQLALRYASDSAQEASAFGAGFTLPISSVRRTVRFVAWLGSWWTRA